ncbi:hypothetical protein [Yinghuangia seranimata]|uniref:hypothetical protein n=1 Tax=Yinghuangia seranimata TaxID=408067 RepID=UPI00248AA51E|nr:hypothetical protein [Yinghuangia seranimata]MDI2125702.1 hypothetical protein [Yinghuangia seranimata]
MQRGQARVRHPGSAGAVSEYGVSYSYFATVACVTRDGRETEGERSVAAQLLRGDRVGVA